MATGICTLGEELHSATGSVRLELCIIATMGIAGVFVQITKTDGNHTTAYGA